MDNLSQNIEEVGLAAGVGANDADDIQFDESIDIDVIQKKLQQQIVENHIADKPVDSEKNETPVSAILESNVDGEAAEPKAEILAPALASEQQPVSSSQRDDFEKKVLKAVSAFTKETDQNSKKYVIYVDANNIDFMENLSQNERRELINKILREQDEISIKKKELAQKRRFFVHALLATVVFIVAFPLMFMLVNKALEATIKNFETAKENFARLYKEQGKIKQGGVELK